MSSAPKPLPAVPSARLLLPVLLVALALCVPAARAEMCTLDAVPAATLLLPYFEVDIENDDCVNTLFSINNASAAPALAHVVFWTDWSAPTIDFDLYLTGYDVVTVNLRDVFLGTLPITATDVVDPNDAISPHGNNPAWDGDFPNCEAFFPFPDPVVTGTAFDRLSNGHRGLPVASLGGACLGQSFDDGIARGYMTVDNVNECSLVLDPNDPLYFTSITSNVNQLWGDYFIVDPVEGSAFGDSLVHIEAEDGFDASSSPTNYTFYGRYTQALGGIDNREPLGTSWATRFLDGGAFTGGTDLIVWRDSTANNLLPSGATCGVGPDWLPLNETQVVVFDEAEDAVELCFFLGGIISPPDDDDPACFPYEAGRYPFGEAPLSSPFDFGWAFLNLNLPPDAPTGDVDFPAGGGNIAQSHVTAVHTASGLFSVGLQAVELTSACDNLDPIILGDYPFFRE
ncbi:MAG: hypothetical protein AAGN66_09980 [Acidobacteriota bacterium]